MKLILTQEVTGLGAPGDIVEVKDGYGRNFLIPRGFAIRWTKGGEKHDRVDQGRSVQRARCATSTRPSEIKAKLEGTTVNVPVRAGEGGRLFGAVTVGDIAARDRRRGRPRSTSARSSSATRSSRSARTRSPSRCTTRSTRPSTSTSSPPETTAYRFAHRGRCDITRAAPVSGAALVAHLGPGGGHQGSPTLRWGFAVGTRGSRSHGGWSRRGLGVIRGLRITDRLHA